jgi:hypothetical protein
VSATFASIRRTLDLDAKAKAMRNDLVKRVPAGNVTEANGLVIEHALCSQTRFSKPRLVAYLHDHPEIKARLEEAGILREERTLPSVRVLPTRGEKIVPPDCGEVPLETLFTQYHDLKGEAVRAKKESEDLKLRVRNVLSPGLYRVVNPEQAEDPHAVAASPGIEIKLGELRETLNQKRLEEVVPAHDLADMYTQSDPFSILRVETPKERESRLARIEADTMEASEEYQPEFF